MIFSSSDLPAHLDDRARFNLWREIFNAEIAPTQFVMTEDVPFQLTFNAVAVGALTYARTFGTIRGAGRTASQTASDDHYTLLINASDQAMGGLYGNRDIEIPTGGALINATRAQQLAGGNYNNWINVRVPMAIMDSAFAKVESREGQLIRPNQEALGLLRRYLTLLDGGPVPTSASVLDHMTATIVDLTGLAIGAQGEEAELAGLRGLRRARLEAVLDRILRDYTLPGLSAEIVGRELGVTGRYVQGLLAETGTSFSERVLELRLQHAKQMLGSPRARDLRIGEIVYASGFNDVSYFNRSFRRRFGCSPGTAR